jgi:hypothetical protein
MNVLLFLKKVFIGIVDITEKNLIKKSNSLFKSRFII